MRHLSLRRWFLGLLLILTPFFSVKACGPDFRPDTFVRPLRPDDLPGYARGQLGLLQPTYLRRELAVAYRYLAGGRLLAAELAAYLPAAPASDATPGQQAKQEADLPFNQWNAAVARYAGRPQPSPASSFGPGQMRDLPPGSAYSYAGEFLNCPDDAYRTAALTLSARAKAFGDPSAALAEWQKGQDAVFANCTGTTPVIPAQVDPSSILPDNAQILRFDREYQIAAAYFYSAGYAEARTRFDAIDAEQASPWHSYAGYLAARSLVRQAFFAKHPANEEFDPAMMAEAQHRLEALLRDPALAKMHPAIQAELNFVRLRTQQGERLEELALALGRPASDPAFGQDLADLTFTLDQHLDQTSLREDSDSFTQGNGTADAAPKRAQAYQAAAGLRQRSPLIDWLLTFQSPSQEACHHAIEMWKQTKSLPWLTAALAKATARDAANPALLEAAAALPQASPAFTTIAFHRARLLIALHRQQEARRLLDRLLPGIRRVNPGSAANAFLGLRMQTARSLPEFLTDAPRRLLERRSPAASIAPGCWGALDNPQSQDCNQKIGALQLDLDASSALNLQFPLSVWIAAARSPELPQNLRDSITIVGWVRSVMLEDRQSAAQLVPLLPKSLRPAGGGDTGFPATLAILRNPGLQPYLEGGVQRSATFNVLDNYRNNWWCGDWKKDWTSGGSYETPPQLLPVPADFLTDADKAAGAGESEKLASIAASGAILFGQRALAYVKQHPDDPDAAEALALTVRATHFGCSEQVQEAERLATAKAAFQLLHKSYPTSTWARKTGVYS